MKKYKKALKVNMCPTCWKDGYVICNIKTCEHECHLCNVCREKCRNKTCFVCEKCVEKYGVVQRDLNGEIEAI